jgi:hypothetical protein
MLWWDERLEKLVNWGETDEDVTMDVRRWMIKDKNDTTEEKEGKMITIFLKDGNDKRLRRFRSSPRRK